MLTPEDRSRAPCIYDALQWAQQAAAGTSGEHEARVLAAEVDRRISAGGGRVDYVEVH